MCVACLQDLELIVRHFLQQCIDVKDVFLQSQSRPAETGQISVAVLS